MPPNASERLVQQSHDQLLYLKYYPTLRRLDRKRRLYERLTGKKADETQQEAAANVLNINPEVERQIESLGEFVGALRSGETELREVFSSFVGGDRDPYYVSAYLRAFLTKRSRTASITRDSEYVLTALDIKEKTYSGKTHTPLYNNPDEFNASLLGFAWNGRKILADPPAYAHEENETHENWIFSSTNTIASHLQVPLIAYEETDQDENEWVCMSFKYEEDNENVNAFDTFLPELQQAMAGYPELLRAEAFDYTTGDNQTEPEKLNRMYTLKFNKFIYDKYNVTYHNKLERPAFSINMPVYIPNRDSHMLLQAGFAQDFSELTDDVTRARFLERIYNEQSPVEPSLIASVDSMMNQKLESFLLSNQLALSPDRIEILDNSLTRLEAHRLRTPLTTIKGYAGILKARLRSGVPMSADDMREFAEFAELIETRSTEMGDNLSDSLLALRRAKISTLEVISAADYFPTLLERTIRELNRQGQTQLVQAVDTHNLRIMLQRMPHIAAVPFGFAAVIENILNNARNYNSGEVPISVFSSMEEVVNPDTNEPEEIVYIDFINQGSEIDPHTLTAINDRGRTVEIKSDNSKGSGRGNVYGRVSMDISNNTIKNTSRPSIFYRVMNLSEVTQGEQSGVMVRLGFKTSRSIKQKVSDLVKIYRVVANGKSQYRDQYLQAALHS